MNIKEIVRNTSKILGRALCIALISGVLLPASVASESDLKPVCYDVEVIEPMPFLKCPKGCF